MKTKKKNLPAIFIIVLLSLIIFGCSEEFSTQSNTDPDYPAMKRNKNFRTLDEALTYDDGSSAYPQTGSGIAYYWPNKETYKGTGFALQNGSSFDLQNGALTPANCSVLCQ
jgi:hypothetical protein